MREPPFPRRRGFTLIELVITITILAILAGAAVPVASKFFQSKARGATRAELADLASAATEFFRDTGVLPETVDDLVQKPALAGWSGPYLTMTSEDPWSGMSDVQVDAWGRPYRFTARGTSLLELASSGEDGAFGAEPDIVFSVDMTPVRRESTLAQLDTLNSAITSYNALYLPDQPLSTSHDRLLDALVASGLLPDAEPFRTDGWGDAFVPAPPGRSPVVAVDSVHLGGSTSKPAGGKAGGKKGGKSPGKSGQGKKKG